ncbi:MAG: S-isoprenylcysteine methyltransferase [Anaerolineales bacterium]|nr:MAG: S-isoprenylcysteine methyltransferase [Anaerolineales bacterium]
MPEKTGTFKATLNAILRLVVGIPMIGALLLLPAGTFDYWQAWAWLATLFIPMSISLVYLMKIDPALLERRTRTNETRPEQRRLIMASVVYLLIVFILPGFDVRYGWSNVPAWLSLAADGVVLASYLLYVLVLKTNTFASRVIEVEQGQQVITSGPYALVRHPMYLAMILMMTATPLALGSYWAMLPSVAFILLLAARIKNEEELLMTELKGYREYTEKTRHRLFPGVW